MNIIIVGGVGNGTVVNAAIHHMIENYSYNGEVIGFVNDGFDPKNGIEYVEKIPVIGNIDQLESLCLDNNACFVNALTSENTIKSINDRYECAYSDFKGRAVSIVHPDTVINYNVTLGRGIFLGPQTYIGQNAIIGDLVFVHSQCYLARDSKIGEFSYLAPKVYVGAEVIIEDRVYLGINSIVKEKVIVRQGGIIGMGSVIVTSTDEHGVYYGNKAIRKN